MDAEAHGKDRGGFPVTVSHMFITQQLGKERIHRHTYCGRRTVIRTKGGLQRTGRTGGRGDLTAAAMEAKAGPLLPQ